MNQHRSAGGVVAFQGYIYALGGHDGLSIYDSVCKITTIFKICTNLHLLYITYYILG
jgi:hypothetical protein